MSGLRCALFLTAPLLAVVGGCAEPVAQAALPVPPIDKAPPAKIETATFALG